MKAKSFKILKSFGGVILVALVFRSILIEPFRIPSGSMIPTLNIGDFIFVNKMAYGLKVPFSDSVIFGKNFDPIYLFKGKGPKRGDVVVFKYPKDVSVNYIKRVVAVPGDEIEIKDKKLYINEKAVRREEIDGERFIGLMNEQYRSYALRFYTEQFEDGESHHVQLDTNNLYNMNLKKIKVPKGHYFVMGDNRDFSSDSRLWGLVKHEYIKGEAFMIWLSFKELLSGDLEIRSEKIGQKI